jgi:hypothetical protein
MDANLTILLPLTIDEKIALWANVTGRAEALGIELFFVTWDVFTGGPVHRTRGAAVRF